MFGIKAKDMRVTAYSVNQLAEKNTREFLEKKIQQLSNEGQYSLVTMALPLTIIEELREAGFVVDISKLSGTNKDITQISW